MGWGEDPEGLGLLGDFLLAQGAGSACVSSKLSWLLGCLSKFTILQGQLQAASSMKLPVTALPPSEPGSSVGYRDQD